MGQRIFECVLSIGTRSARSIMASGFTAAQTGRTHDRTRPMLQLGQKVLAKAAPSTHDPKRTPATCFRLLPDRQSHKLRCFALRPSQRVSCFRVITNVQRIAAACSAILVSAALAQAQTSPRASLGFEKKNYNYSEWTKGLFSEVWPGSEPRTRVERAAQSGTSATSRASAAMPTIRSSGY